MAPVNECITWECRLSVNMYELVSCRGGRQLVGVAAAAAGAYFDHALVEAMEFNLFVSYSFIHLYM